VRGSYPEPLTTSSCRRPNQESRPSLASFGLLGCSCVTASVAAIGHIAAVAAISHIAAVSSAPAVADTVFLQFFCCYRNNFAFIYLIFIKFIVCRHVARTLVIGR
jgi:hypothetical protein